MRQNYSLNGTWKFVIDPYDIGEGMGTYYLRVPKPSLRFLRGFDKILWKEVQVPGSWNVEDPQLEWYEGIVWYAREFTIPRSWERRKVWLRFEAVNYMCKVWLNGRYVGSHEGGYTPFEFNITDSLKAGKNLLVVKVDNRSGPDHLAPTLGWFNYGGIYRGVSLYSTREVRLKWLAILPYLEDTHKYASLDIRCEMENTDTQTVNAWLEIKIKDPEAKLVRSLINEVSIKPGSLKRKKLRIRINAPLLWSPQTPRLYSAESEVFQKRADGKSRYILDRIEEKFGIRKIEIKDGQIELNSEKIFLKGVGKHDDYPGLGRTLSKEIWQKDFKLIKDMNANAVRLAHYPHDRREIELADREGLLLWEEIPLYGSLAKVNFNNPAILKKAKIQMEELIRRDINHPSVIIWGIGNEIASDTESGEKVLKALYELTKKLDSSRPVTFASNPISPKKNISQRFVDILSLNIYRGWYRDNIAEILTDIKDLHETYPEKPIIISEFGAGCVAGFHSKNKEKWSEEYQEWVLSENIKYMLKSRFLNGFFIWCFADYKDPSREFNIYQRGYNNKGLLNENRKPKKAYFTVQKLLA